MQTCKGVAIWRAKCRGSYSQDDFGDDDEDDVDDDWKPPTAYMKKGQRGERA